MKKTKHALCYDPQETVVLFDESKQMTLWKIMEQGVAVKFCVA